MPPESLPTYEDELRALDVAATINPQ